MKEIQTGKTFVIKVPNSRLLTLKTPLTSTSKFQIRVCDDPLKNQPVIKSLEETGLLTIEFGQGYNITEKVKLLLTEEPSVVETIFETTSVTDKLTHTERLQYLRSEILASHEQLTPRIGETQALTFDQSYFLRGLGQVQVQYELECREGLLSKRYPLMSGMGFGALQACFAAMGKPSEFLLDWWINDFRKVLKPSFIEGMGFRDRRSTRAVENCIRGLFRMTNTSMDRTLSDLESNVFIPVMDINGRVLILSKKQFPAMPVYLAVMCSLPCPLFFETKALLDGYGVLLGDVKKTPDVFLAKNNPNLRITSIGSPVRIFNNSGQKVSREALSLIFRERKHQFDLDEAHSFMSMAGRPWRRLECKPLDDLKQFQFDDLALRKSILSGRIFEGA